jgi:hypothetical protein
MKPEGRLLLPKEKQKELENKYDATIKGGMEEEKVYDKLRERLKKNTVKNTVVINGWKDKGTGKLDESHPLYREQKEFDFLIVSQPNQIIIHIEVKRTCSESNLKSATKQLKNGLNMFQDTIPFPMSQNWKYIRVIYFGLADKGVNFEEHSLHHIKEAKPFENHCLKCKNLIIGPKTDFNLWWNELTKCVLKLTPETMKKHHDDTYLNVLRFLLHQMYKQKDCATTSQLVQETSQTSDKICVPDTIIFWSKDQLKTLNDLSNHRVAFTSAYGTGKTILIQSKAKELLKSKENRIVIIIFEATLEETLLRSTYGKVFGNYFSAKIIGIHKKGTFILVCFTFLNFLQIIFIKTT